MNPDKVEARLAELEERNNEARKIYLDDEAHERYMKSLFMQYPEQRTDHKGIIPPKDRIKNYKIHTIKRAIPSAMPAITKGLLPQKSADFKIAPTSAKWEVDKRPVTAAFSMQGMSEATTAVSGGLQSAHDIGLKARAVSLSRFSKFEEQEKAVQKHPFGVFFTSNEPTAYH